MCVFKIPLSLCDELKSLISRFWWGCDVNEMKIHWLTWEKLCRLKAHGGLGFRDISAFNRALFVKQCWQIIMMPTSLMARVVKAKYFPTASVLEVAN